jgi:hypothetical protein
LTKPEIRRRVKAIAKTKMTDDWEWGKAPHDRENPVPIVSTRKTLPDILFIPTYSFYADIYFMLTYYCIFIV